MFLLCGGTSCAYAHLGSCSTCPPEEIENDMPMGSKNCTHFPFLSEGASSDKGDGEPLVRGDTDAFALSRSGLVGWRHCR